MGFQEFGEMLQHLRVEKGLAIDDVARRIKISGRTLQEFEDGVQHCSLHPVYCRGFAKAYAEFLGMDKTVLEDALNVLYPPEDEEYDSPVLRINNRKQSIGSGKLAALALIILLLGGGWYLYANGLPELSWLPNLSEILKSEDSPAGNATTNTPEMGNIVTPQADSAQPAIPPQTGTTAASNAENLAAEAGNAQQNMASITPEIGIAPPVQANSTAPGADGSSGPHRLVIITGSSDCWTESRVDNEEKRAVYLKGGQTHILTFQRSLNLRLGNINGVKLRLDGQPYEIPPGQGNARQLILGETTGAANRSAP